MRIVVARTLCLDSTHRNVYIHIQSMNLGKIQVEMGLVEHLRDQDQF